MGIGERTGKRRPEFGKGRMNYIVSQGQLLPKHKNSAMCKTVSFVIRLNNLKAEGTVSLKKKKKQKYLRQA